MAEGYYLYCITGTGEARSYGHAGIGNRNDEVLAINYEDLSCVASISPLSEYAVTRENLLAHQKVIEDVMKNNSVLPIRFSTIAKNADDVVGVLRKRYVEFKDLQKKMEGKMELGIKALWKDMRVVWKDIAKENTVIRLKDKMAGTPLRNGFNANVELGRAVRASLERKKEEAAGKIISVFGNIAVDTRANKTHGDNMVVNAAFLVDRAQAAEFDRRVIELDERGGGNMSLKYVGPVPPFNFISIVIELD